jgi:hypothetical protein
MDWLWKYYSLRGKIMAHFAQLDENNKVINVIVVHNNELLDDDGNESEAKGIAFCKDLFGSDTQWVQTSYNATFRKTYAGIDSVYDPAFDVFIPLRPYDSWKYDYENLEWVAPVPKPEFEEGYTWLWSEVNQEWVKK